MVEIQQIKGVNLDKNRRAGFRLILLDESSITCNNLQELKRLIDTSKIPVVLAMPSSQFIKGKRGWAKAQILSSVTHQLAGVYPLSFEAAQTELERNWKSVEINGAVGWPDNRVIKDDSKNPNATYNFEVSSSVLDLKMMQTAKDQIAKSNCWLDPAGVVITRGGEILVTGVSTTYNHVDCPAIPVKFADLPLDPGERMQFCGSLHAERVAISQAAMAGVKLEGGTIYVSKFPCNPCATAIIASGITRVMFEKDSYGIGEAYELLAKNNIGMTRVKETS